MQRKIISDNLNLEHMLHIVKKKVYIKKKIMK